MYLYKIKINSLKDEKQDLEPITNISHSKIGLINSFCQPQLDCCFERSDNNYIYSVGLDKEIKIINLESCSYSILGRHEEPISIVISSKEGNCVYTSGWDGKLKFWDFRSKNEIGVVNPEMNISHLAISRNNSFKMIAAGISEIEKGESDVLKFFDLRKMLGCVKREISPLKNQTTALCASENSDRYIVGCLDGRICSDSFENESENQQYIFKSHREETDSKILIYPVTAATFHPSKSVYLSGGADKVIYAWDDKKRKKLFKSPKYPEGITSLTFNNDGSILAIASSFLPKSSEEYSLGENENSTQNSIFIKTFDR